MTRALLTRLTLATALSLAAAPVLAFDPAEMTAAERTAFGEQVRAYILENPEIIMEAYALLEQRNAQAEAAADTQLIARHAAELFEDDHSWVGGNPEGDITLVEFMDYRCGYCRRATPEVASLLESDGNIRLIIKEFPILGESSLLSSRFAVATKLVAGDAAYHQVHDALLELNSDATEVTLRRLGDGLGLETEAILAHMDSDEVTEILVKNRELAQQLSISGTPTFVLQDRMLRGFLPAEPMAQIVADIRG